MPQEILQVNDSEKQWIISQIDGCAIVIESLVGEAMNADRLLKQMDEAYAVWYSDAERKNNDPNPVINVFGLTFGQYLCDQLNLGWVVVKDEFGTEIAVHGQPGDILMFPTNLVAKRFERGEIKFFEGLFSAIRQQIHSAGSKTISKKSWWKIW